MNTNQAEAWSAFADSCLHAHEAGRTTRMPIIVANCTWRPEGMKVWWPHVQSPSHHAQLARSTAQAYARTKAEPLVTALVRSIARRFNTRTELVDLFIGVHSSDGPNNVLWQCQLHLLHDLQGTRPPVFIGRSPMTASLPNAIAALHKRIDTMIIARKMGITLPNAQAAG